MTREEFAERIATQAIELLDSEHYVQLSKIYRRQPDAHSIPRSPARKAVFRKDKAREVGNWQRQFVDGDDESTNTPADNLAIQVGQAVIEVLNGQLYDACRSYVLACTIPGADGMQVALNLLKLVLEDVEGREE